MYSIAEAARLIGVPIPTLRTWERRHGIGPTQRSPGGHRRYASDDIARIRVFRDAVTQGHRPGAAAKRVAQIPTQVLVDAFVDAAARFDPSETRRILDSVTDEIGFERAAAEFVLPAMQFIGQSWADASLDVAQEHFATREVQGWLSWHELLAPRGTRGGVVVACGPDELHTLALDAFAVMLKHRRWDVRNLGSLTPGPSLLVAVAETHARGVVVTAHMRANRRATVAALRQLVALRDTALFFAGAAFVAPSARRGVPGSYLGDDLPEAVRAFSETVGL